MTCFRMIATWCFGLAALGFGVPISASASGASNASPQLPPGFTIDKGDWPLTAGTSVTLAPGERHRYVVRGFAGEAFMLHVKSTSIDPLFEGVADLPVIAPLVETVNDGSGLSTRVATELFEVDADQTVELLVGSRDGRGGTYQIDGFAMCSFGSFGVRFTHGCPRHPLPQIDSFDQGALAVPQNGEIEYRLLPGTGIHFTYHGTPGFHPVIAVVGYGFTPVIVVDDLPFDPAAHPFVAADHPFQDEHGVDRRMAMVDFRLSTEPRNYAITIRSRWTEGGTFRLGVQNYPDPETPYRP